MDTLIALGRWPPWPVSAVEAIALGGRHVHLGGSGAFAARLHGVMAPLIIAILATGRAIEARARARAARGAALAAVAAPTHGPAGDRGGGRGGQLVAPETVPVGALVRVLAGETIPLDGDGGAGWSAVDESMLTGEPLPVDRGPGSQVTGGTRNGSGVLVVRVGAVAAESVLARLQRLVDEAQRDKAPLQRLADRISGVFVPAVLVGAAVTFLAGGSSRERRHRRAQRPGRPPGGLPVRHGPGRPGGDDGRLRAGGGARASSSAAATRSSAWPGWTRSAFDKTGTLTERRATGWRSTTGRRGRTAKRCWPWPRPSRRTATTPSPGPSAPHRPRRRGHRRARSLPGSACGHGRRPAGRGGARRCRPRSQPRSRGRGRRYEPGGDGGRRRRATECPSGVLAVATPLRPEAAGAVGQLRDLGCDRHPERGQRRRRAARWPASLGIDDARGPDPGRQAGPPCRDLRQGRPGAHGGRRCQRRTRAGGSRSGLRHRERFGGRLTTSDVALVGNDLHGVPAARGGRPPRRDPARTSAGPWATTSRPSPWRRPVCSTRCVAAIAMGLSSLSGGGQQPPPDTARSGARPRCARPGLTKGRRGCVVAVAPPGGPVRGRPRSAPRWCHRPRGRACCPRSRASSRCRCPRAVRPRSICPRDRPDPTSST